MSGTITYVVGDTLPELLFTYTGVDITGHTITLHINQRPTPLVKACTIVDGPGGTFKAVFAAGDLKAGDWPAEVQVIDTAGGVLTYQGLRLAVAREIA